METLERIRAKPLQRSSQVYLYRPNLPEGCIDLWKPRPATDPKRENKKFDSKETKKSLSGFV